MAVYVLITLYSFYTVDEQRKYVLQLLMSGILEQVCAIMHAFTVEG